MFYASTICGVSFVTAVNLFDLNAVGSTTRIPCERHVAGDQICRVNLITVAFMPHTPVNSPYFTLQISACLVYR